LKLKTGGGMRAQHKRLFCGMEAEARRTLPLQRVPGSAAGRRRFR